MKKIMKMNHHQKASALQVTLLLISVLMQCILAFSIYLQNTARYDQSIIQINEQRQIEIYFQRYLKQIHDNDILLSDSIQFENGSIKYTVDDMGSYYLINADIKTENYEYEVSMEMSLDDGHMIHYEYH